MTKPISSVLTAQLEPLALRVELRYAGKPQPMGEVSPPVAADLWLNSYALLMVVAVQDLTIVALGEAHTLAEDWISERLAHEERQGRLLDGYLLLALPRQPGEELAGAIRDLSSSTEICRKHVIWTDEDSSWLKALLGVTVLGLPEARRADVLAISSPNLPIVATRALDLYGKLGKYEAVAEALEADAKAEAHSKSNAN